jgi:hypothetical protein
VPTDVWLPLVTFGLGFAGSLAIEERRDRRLATREADARTAERAVTREERRDEFQRDTLLMLQDVIGDLARVTTRVHLNDCRQRSEGAQWRNARVGAELNEESRLTNIALSKLRERVIDDELRGLVSTFHNATTVVLISPSEQEAVCAFNTMSDGAEQAQKRLGELLRALY